MVSEIFFGFIFRFQAYKDFVSGSCTPTASILFVFDLFHGNAEPKSVSISARMLRCSSLYHFREILKILFQSMHIVVATVPVCDTSFHLSRYIFNLSRSVVITRHASAQTSSEH
jgi:hypothetical protein